MMLSTMSWSWLPRKYTCFDVMRAYMLSRFRSPSPSLPHRSWSMAITLGIGQIGEHSLYDTEEGNVLFNDALNTFYLRLYGIRHMVKDHSDSEKGNLLPPHRLLFTITNKGYFICTIPQTGQNIPQYLLYQSWNTGWKEK